MHAFLAPPARVYTRRPSEEVELLASAVQKYLPKKGKADSFVFGTSSSSCSFDEFASEWAAIQFEQEQDAASDFVEWLTRQQCEALDTPSRDNNCSLYGLVQGACVALGIRVPENHSLEGRVNALRTKFDERFPEEQGRMLNLDTDDAAGRTNHGPALVALINEAFANPDHPDFVVEVFRPFLRQYTLTRAGHGYEPANRIDAHGRVDAATRGLLHAHNTQKISAC